MPTAAERGLVGRALEVEVLETAARKAAEAQPQTVIVAGEAGVGETRPVEVAGIRAAAGGALVLKGASGEHAAEVPFLAVAEALRELPQLIGLEVIRELVGDDHAELAVLLPELGLPDASAAVGPAAQGRLFV